ncbi:membrane fusion protein, multidrug efflux system [Algoriella xinjiangensis]|uniref:Membrane fusion protein, multidrug efflux system n=1 Tax=Algoriella xinjiangensis TaxID=684065 RepID=A0A1I4Y302_9FLAO|nr:MULTISPECIES: HlyD family secretion protein [Algoriella]MBO6212040.1 HlyD family secretion protein [Algoriella sp.]SFN31890.1 membrane fusion protein, multidrug efflux system [Algoriella xinjiangensis]VDH15340.1 Inner membrane protein yibH [Algoriella xinjiangensis]
MAKQLTKGEKRMNRTLSVIAWLFILIGVGALGWFYLFSSSHVSTNDAQVRQYITPVSSKVSGFINKINFDENQFVHKGDTLVVIDNREFQNQIDIAQANLESTTQSVATYETAVDSKASNVNIVNANIEAAKIEVWRTEKDFTRFKNLVAEDAATLQQFEEIEAKYKQAKASLSALEQQRNAVNVSTSAEQTKVAPAKTQILQRKAQLNDAKLRLSYTYVIAPYDGWVGVKNIQVGQLIKEGQALVQVVSKEKWVIANFKETQLGEIDLDKTVKVKADAYATIEFEGKIESLSPASGSEFSLVKPDNATGNFVKIEQRFPVKIILKESKNNEKLRSGMNVEVSAEKLK